jgi:phage terminase large subunit
MRDFHAHGAIAELFWLADEAEPGQIFEILIDGPAGTGKTLGISEFLEWCLRMWVGVRIAVVRKTLTSLRTSWQVTWEDKCLEPGHVLLNGGASRYHRTHYQHENGSTIELHGMDQATRLLSTEYDIVYVNEAIELTLSEWEMLHRCLRNNRLPFQMLLGDTNPGPPQHWLKVRCDTGRCLRLRSRHEDNPALPEAYLEDLRTQLTGVRFKRLYEGIWAAAEGLVWENWDDDAHLISAKIDYRDDGTVWLYDVVDGAHGLGDWIELRWFLGAQDIGWDSPGCAQLFGFDRDKRAYCVAECYRRHWHYEEWAEMWARWWARFQPIRKIVTDWDEEFQDRLRKLLRLYDTPGVVGNWSKRRGKSGEKTGIDAVRRRFERKGDGTRGLYFLRDRMSDYPDPDLARRGHPLRFEDEVAAWVYPPFEERKRHDEPEPDPLCPDHACDATRGAMDWAEGKDLSARDEEPGIIPGSARDVLDRAKRGQEVI